MKHLIVESQQFNYLIKGFSQWLDTFGYAQQTVQGLPVHIREFMHYIEKEHCLSDIAQVKNKHVFLFVKHLEHRRSDRTGRGLSAASINKEILALHCFSKYLQATGRMTLDAYVPKLEDNLGEPTVLTVDEIRALYDATFYDSRENAIAMGQRDRAIIAVFYGCGLRKDEATRLNVGDINLERAMLFVSKGKGNKERFVPIARQSLDDLKAYIREGRNWFLGDNARSTFYKKTGRAAPPKKNMTDMEALFFSQHGGRLKSGFYKRLEVLKERAGIEKDFSLHSLRHSIATHLMQSGMDMEDIAKFLGHASLDSTQIYTHIVEGMNNLSKTTNTEQSIKI